VTASRFYRAIPNAKECTDRDLVSCFIYHLTIEQGAQSATVQAIMRCFVDCDLPVPKRLRQFLSEGISKAQSRYIKTSDGYRLHKHNAEKISQSLGERQVEIQVSAELRKLESSLPEGHARTFLTEAIDCFEAGASRAAIIMTWVLAMNLLNNYIVSSKLAEFNAALTLAPAGKVKFVTTYDELNDLKESKIIELAKSANIISKDVWKVMDQALDTRNSCAHPAELVVKKSKAIAIIEDLFENVISQI
jgi:hypothetical protein